MRGRGGLNKIGVLALVLLLAMGAMGTAYGAWIDEIYIDGTLSTSGIYDGLTCGTCWEEVDGEVADVDDTDIDCDEVDPITLTITISGALQNVEVEEVLKEVDYYCEFEFSNDVTSWPILIQSLDLSAQTTSGKYDGVMAVIESSPEGTVIDPGDKATGTVHIYLTSAEQVGKELSFTLTAVVK